MTLRLATVLRNQLVGLMNSSAATQNASGSSTPMSGSFVQDKSIAVTPLKQEFNACGTTSMAMIFNSFGIPVSPQDLDARYRQGGGGTTVTNMDRAGDDVGLYSSVVNNADFNTVREEIDKNNLMAAQVTTRTGQSHYVVIHGYRVSQEGNQEILITNPASGKTMYVDYDTFAQDYWLEQRDRSGNVKTDQLLITYSADNDVPESNYAPSPLNLLVSSSTGQQLLGLVRKLKS